jgi:hypothetical protein
MSAPNNELAAVNLSSEVARLALIGHFDDKVVVVLHALHANHHYLQGMSPTDVRILAEAVRDEVMDTIRRVPIECREQPNPQTRYEGLSALTIIGYLIACAGGNELSLQVRNHFDCISVLERAMLQIVGQMTFAEKLTIRDCEDGNGCPLLPRIKHLQALGRACLLYDNMDWVIDALEEASFSNGEEDSDDTEDVI